jgi:uncharacterized protein (DUF1697 family)
MPLLKTVFENAGLTDVRTYINSGNVIFRDTTHTPGQLIDLLEKLILDEFGFAVSVLIRDINEMKAIAEALPETWRNDSIIKCDVMFLWKDVDSEDVLTQLVVKPGIDNVRYVPGAVLFAVERQNVTKSGLMKLIGTPLYKRMTLRNSNTTRKLLEIMKLIET